MSALLAFGDHSGQAPTQQPGKLRSRHKGVNVPKFFSCLCVRTWTSTQIS